MRRTDREITDPAVLREMLGRCKVCRLGLLDGDEVYIVPMNFGYTWEDELPTLYFHCAAQGRKIELLKAHPKVSFELDGAHRLGGEGDLGCDYTYFYESLMGVGVAGFVEDEDAKRTALGRIMAHQTGREGFVFDETWLKSTAVIRVKADALSGKRHG